MYKQKYLIPGDNENKSEFRKSLGELKIDSDLILEVLDSVLFNQHNILDRLSGCAIGKVQENLTIMELKSVFPNDQFSDEESDRHGTDIISTIWESGINLGNVTISVKHQNRWSSEFVTQLERNIMDDETRWGFLVTTKFPADALNDNIWTARTGSGRLILLVKPQFASIAYYAIRTIIIYESQLKKIIMMQNTKNNSSFQNSNKKFTVKDDSKHRTVK
jgi:hypothetical protein